MKRRMGFVSNSSSSSFIVAKSVLTTDQLEKLINYKAHYTHDGKFDESSNYKDCYFGDWWNILDFEEAEVITGFTTMDNGDMSKYMIEECGINLNVVTFEGD